MGFMKRRLAQGALLYVLITFPILVHAEPIRHEMKIVLQPEKGRIEVSDTITLPETVFASGKRLHFLLHGGLKPVSPTTGVAIVLEEGKPQAAQFGMNPTSFALNERIPLEHYSVTLPAGTRSFALKYQGEIYHPLKQEGEEYARSFTETPGMISSDGVFLAGATYWYPWFNDGLVSFTLDVKVPKGWDAVSQGERAQHRSEDNLTRVRWDSPGPQSLPRYCVIS